MAIAALSLAACGGTGTTSASMLQATPPPSGSPTPSPAPTASPTPTGTPASSPTPTPILAPGTTVIDNAEQSPWLTCGNCGNNLGTGATAAYFDTRGMVIPSEDGASTRFSIAATVPYTNGYFFQVNAPVGIQLSAVTYEFDLYIPQGSESSSQAIEFECQQVLDGWVYNFAWQAGYAGHAWTIFNYSAKTWEPSGIYFAAFSPETWHHILAEYHSDAVNHAVWHDALTVDGTKYLVNISHPAVFVGGSNQFTNAFQLDSNIVPTPYSVNVDKMRITYR